MASVYVILGLPRRARSALVARVAPATFRAPLVEFRGKLYAGYEEVLQLEALLAQI